MQLPCCYFTLYKRITLTQAAYFSNTYYHTQFQDHILDGASIAFTSQVCEIDILLVRVPSNIIRSYQILLKSVNSIEF